MKKDGTKKDAMAKDAVAKGTLTKDTMAKDDMSKDAMAKDAMKHDAMVKDAMAKDANEEVSWPPLGTRNGVSGSLPEGRHQRRDQWRHLPGDLGKVCVPGQFFGHHFGDQNADWRNPVKSLAAPIQSKQ